MKSLRGPIGIGYRPAAVLLLILIWCTSLTTSTPTTPTRTRNVVHRKRSSDSTPLLIQEDQCASVRTNVGDELKRLLNLQWMESSEEIEMCLCSSTLSNFVEQTKNKQIEIAKAFVGSENVTEALQTLISRSSPEICDALPSHAIRSCNSDGRRSDICDFTCQSPFRKTGNGSEQKCVLPASPSASARLKKRSLNEEVVLMHTNYCQPHERVCARNGLSSDSFHPSSSYYRASSQSGHGTGSSLSAQFECTDVSKDLFNCGGCAAGALGLEVEELGVDCSELPGVSDVQCVKRRCRVSRCGKGWKVNSRGDGCVRNRG